MSVQNTLPFEGDSTQLLLDFRDSVSAERPEKTSDTVVARKKIPRRVGYVSVGVLVSIGALLAASNVLPSRGEGPSITKNESDAADEETPEEAEAETAEGNQNQNEDVSTVEATPPTPEEIEKSIEEAKNLWEQRSLFTSTDGVDALLNRVDKALARAGSHRKGIGITSDEVAKLYLNAARNHWESANDLPIFKWDNLNKMEEALEKGGAVVGEAATYPKEINLAKVEELKASLSELNLKKRAKEDSSK